MTGRIAAVLIGGGLLLGAAGCSQMLVGTWRSIEPVTAAPEIPYIRQITFAPDGRFHGILSRGGAYETITGSYAFDGYQLSLRADDAGSAAIVPCPAELAGDVLCLRHGGLATRLCREPRAAPPTSARPRLPSEPAAATQPAARASQVSPAPSSK